LSTPAADPVTLENQRLRRLRVIVDLASMLLKQTDIPLAEAVRLVQAVRFQALELFPGKETTWDIIYAPRFARILREKYNVDYPES
jgi:hypothetical protein